MSASPHAREMHAPVATAPQCYPACARCCWSVRQQENGGPTPKTAALERLQVQIEDVALEVGGDLGCVHACERLGACVGVTCVF